MSDLKDKSNMKLSAVIEVDSFFYGIFNESYQLQKSDRVSLKECITAEDYIQRILEVKDIDSDYSARHICCKTTNHLFLPKGLGFIPPSPSNHTSILTESFLRQNVEVAWTIDDALISAIQTVFSEDRVYHISTVFSDYIFPSQRSTLLAHLDKNRIHLLYYNEGDFQFYNAYDVVKAEDYLYFIIQVYRVNGLDPGQDKIIISGDLFEDSALYRLLRRYIQYMEFVNPALFKLKSGMPDNIKHRYFDLYANHICE